jgi:N-glycosyltransferase
MTDQPANAARCAEAGVACVLPHDEVTPARIRQACMEVLDDPSYRLNARRMRSEMLALPPIDAFIADVESLVASREPRPRHGLNGRR